MKGDEAETPEHKTREGRKTRCARVGLAWRRWLASGSCAVANRAAPASPSGWRRASSPPSTPVSGRLRLSTRLAAPQPARSSQRKDTLKQKQRKGGGLCVGRREASGSAGTALLASPSPAVTGGRGGAARKKRLYGFGNAHARDTIGAGSLAADGPGDTRAEKRVKVEGHMRGRRRRARGVQQQQ